jgi:hypothetical protein
MTTSATKPAPATGRSDDWALRQGLWFGLLVGFIWIWLVLWIALSDTYLLGNIRFQDHDTYEVFAWVLYGSGGLVLSVGGIRGSIVKRTMRAALAIGLWQGIFTGLVLFASTVILHFGALGLLSHGGAVMAEARLNPHLTARGLVIRNGFVYGLYYLLISVVTSVPSAAVGGWFGILLRPPATDGTQTT